MLRKARLYTVRFFLHIFLDRRVNALHGLQFIASLLSHLICPTVPQFSFTHYLSSAILSSINNVHYILQERVNSNVPFSAFSRQFHSNTAYMTQYS